MIKVPLEAHDISQMRLWRQQVFEIYDRYKTVFEDYGLDEDLRNLLNNLYYLLTMLCTKLPYQLKIARVREFLSELDRFRVFSLRYLGRIAEQLYRDVREVIVGFNVSEVVEE